MSAIWVLTDLPLFGPAFGFALLLAAVLAPALGRKLSVPPWLLFGLLASAGLIGAVTLTPTSLALSEPWLSTVSSGCHVGSLRMPSLTSLIELNEASLNVLLFVPFGMACGLLRHPGQIAVVSAAGALVPFCVEFVQDSMPGLGRVCTTDDVMANLLGLSLGLAAGLVLNAARLGVRHTADIRR